MKTYFKVIFSATVLLSGCDIPAPAEPTSANDQCLRATLFQDCMKALPAGPQSTKYNDWSEVVDECDSVASRLSWRQLKVIKQECRG